MINSNPSRDYFNEVAGQWDTLQNGHFQEAVREAAIAKAYLRPEMKVADVGCGTGFMTTALARLVNQVFALDGSPVMLETARKNLAGFNNIHFQEADGLNLPLPDNQVDAVFANMYLHHCPDPLAAIREMQRILRPGGRLVITDLDTHTHEWMKTEMSDVWLGFEREQLLAWYQEAGLVNRLLDCTGESCCAEPNETSLENEGENKGQISVFVAVGSKPVQGARDNVKENYGALALKSCCCSSAEPVSNCCESPENKDEIIIQPGYSAGEVNTVPEEAAGLYLGCGNPTAFAGLKAGDRVLDIGSGAGMDSFLAARAVGPTGSVIGVDMTPNMIKRARRAAVRGGFSQVKFRQGQAEALPLEDGSVDVVLSNCVINLCEDKGQVFNEAYRVLAEGGRLEVSDIVTSKGMPVENLNNSKQWADCISGALPEQEYVDLIKQAGFSRIQVRKNASAGKLGDIDIYSAQVSAYKISPCSCGCIE